MDFKKMNLRELAEFWVKDLEKEPAQLDNMKTMSLWTKAFYAAVHNSSGMEILQALHEFKDEDMLQQVDNLKERFLDIFMGDLLEEVKQLKTSVQVLLKQHEGEPANISVHELNNLKGGIK